MTPAWNAAPAESYATMLAGDTLTAASESHTNSDKQFGRVFAKSSDLAASLRAFQAVRAHTLRAHLIAASLARLQRFLELLPAEAAVNHL